MDEIRLQVTATFVGFATVGVRGASAGEPPPFEGVIDMRLVADDIWRCNHAHRGWGEAMRCALDAFRLVTDHTS